MTIFAKLTASSRLFCPGRGSSKEFEIKHVLTVPKAYAMQVSAAKEVEWRRIRGGVIPIPLKTFHIIQVNSCNPVKAYCGLLD